MIRILVTGKNGQVGWELQRSLQCLGEVVATDRAQLDLARPESLAAKLDEIAPDVIVNAAAYTAVDRAESEEALATRVNGESPGVIAEWAARRGALLVHYSTDYVFDGTGTEAWQPTDKPNPLSAYGRSKLSGERAVIATAADYIVFRTSWVFASRGRNFFLTILRLAKERDELRVVNDQWGAPTSARLVADTTAHALAQSLRERREGIFRPALLHISAAGSTTWHGFASEILRTASMKGLQCKARRIVAVDSDTFQALAKRPNNSRLDCSHLQKSYTLHMPEWQVGLHHCIDEILCAAGG